MKFYGLAAGAIAAAFLVTAATSSDAAPLPNLSLMKGAALEQSQIEKTHGWHRSCRRGISEYHRHVKGVGRVQCRSARCTTNWLGYKTCKYF